MKDYRKIGEDIAYTLLGTCMSDVFMEGDRLIEEGQITTEEWNKYELEICCVVDNITFQCEQCGWWCEAGDYAEDCNEEEICSGCGT